MTQKRSPLALLTAILLTFSAPMAYADDHRGTLDKIRKSGEFTIGYRTDASPLSYVNADGEPSGYSVDICRRIAAAIKGALGDHDIETKFVPVSSDERISAVEKGKVDIECGSTTITLGRQESVDFTIPTFVTGGSVLSLADNPVVRLADLAGRRVAVVKDTTTVELLKTHLNQNLLDATVISVNDREQGMSMLNEGEVDAFASDQIVLIGQVIEAQFPRKYSLSNETFSYEPYGLMVKRNDADFRLLANRAIVQLYRSGQHIEIFNKWIGRIGVKPSPMLAAMYQLHVLPE